MSRYDYMWDKSYRENTPTPPFKPKKEMTIWQARSLIFNELNKFQWYPANAGLTDVTERILEALGE